MAASHPHFPVHLHRQLVISIEMQAPDLKLHSAPAVGWGGGTAEKTSLHSRSQDQRPESCLCVWSLLADVQLAAMKPFVPSFSKHGAFPLPRATWLAKGPQGGGGAPAVEKPEQ